MCVCVCVRVCVLACVRACVCVCVCTCVHDNSKNNGSINLKQSDEFHIRHCLIKVMVMA